jgi:ubiquinol-cytochrome c reductase cytochrome b subunit
VLGWCGANVPEGIYLIISRIATAYYFLHFLVVIPVISLLEKPRTLPTSISKPILERPNPAFKPTVAAGHGS